jgi:hypothetical protein
VDEVTSAVPPCSVELGGAEDGVLKVIVTGVLDPEVKVPTVHVADTTLPLQPVGRDDVSIVAPAGGVMSSVTAAASDGPAFMTVNVTD